MFLFNTFRDTVFLKDESDLQKRYDALQKLNIEYPNNSDIKSELYYIKKGMEGEKEIAYRLKKANIGMYVLHDINLSYEDLNAQIDYVVITKGPCFFVECKNLVGNITVTEKGDFVREYIIDGKKIKKGMPSPIRQAEDQKEVLKKIWYSSEVGGGLVRLLKKTLWEKDFDIMYKVIAVAANPETILNTSKAPANLKYKVIRADGLVNQIEYELEHTKKDMLISPILMKKIAERFMKLNKEKNIDYYNYYKDKYIAKTKISDDKLKDVMIAFRKKRSEELKMPEFYIFTDSELDKLIEVRPTSIEELKNILRPDKKIEVHGAEIIKIVNKKEV